MVARRCLFKGKIPKLTLDPSIKEIVQSIVNFSWDKEPELNLDPLLIDLLKRVLDPDPRTRITMSQVLAHPFFE